MLKINVSKIKMIDVVRLNGEEWEEGKVLKYLRSIVRQGREMKVG